ncbi:amidohydrolase family protein, partial [Klebsiella pneumoniae]
MRRRHIALPKLADWMAAAPAARMGLTPRKGRLAAGYDADFVVWDPEATFTVHKDFILHKHKETPYEGRKCHGSVRATWLRGTKIYDQTRF